MVGVCGAGGERAKISRDGENSYYVETNGLLFSGAVMVLQRYEDMSESLAV